MQTVHSGVLRRAAALFGGAEALAAYLRVPQAWLEAWMRGEGAPPIAVFLQAVDILAERDWKTAHKTPGPLHEQLGKG